MGAAMVVSLYDTDQPDPLIIRPQAGGMLLLSGVRVIGINDPADTRVVMAHFFGQDVCFLRKCRDIFPDRDPLSHSGSAPVP